MPTFPPATPHGDLQPIFEDAWFVTGSVQFKPLVRLSRNMVVLRHAGELTLINSVRLGDAGLEALDALGKVAHVMKIGLHGMDDAFYVDRYGARMWAVPGGGGPPGAKPLEVDGETPIPGLRVFRFQETQVPEAALLWQRNGGLLITCDSVQHWAPSDLMSPVAKLLTGIMGFKKPAQIGPPWRKRQTKPGGTLRTDFERLAALPFERLIGGHGGLLDRNAAPTLRASIVRELGAD